MAVTPLVSAPPAADSPIAGQEGGAGPPPRREKPRSAPRVWLGAHARAQSPCSRPPSGVFAALCGGSAESGWVASQSFPASCNLERRLTLSGSRRLLSCSERTPCFHLEPGGSRPPPGLSGRRKEVVGWGKFNAAGKTSRKKQPSSRSSFNQMPPTCSCYSVQDPAPFHQPISFNTTWSHTAGSISHACTYQPASPCATRAHQTCICNTCWKSSGRNNFKPQRGLTFQSVFTTHPQASFHNTSDQVNMEN
ncbi:uncharacterized protein LOC132509173 [Lagenorhynchus albirostris]|uniref:uncharacterized protein LOC132509173 n=1 Tax=Lagenorhynchus albirostris TaxID=27610 RepID=UPI0028E61496|nr:uncharacterized protein LOC132509173 [Lagenorhynchus albirostris]